MKVSRKSKKERVKRLSLVNGKSWSSHVMRAVVGVNNDDGSNGNLKRLKLSKKSLNGCKVAGKTAVPRRLRTAMKKHGCESPSPDSPSIKKQSNSTLENEMPKQNIVKQSKKDATLNWSPRKSSGVTMTKDEEEVAEILFAMASMLPMKEASQDAGYGHYSAQTDKLVLSVATECSTPVLEGSRIRSDLGAPAQSVAHEVMSISVNEGKHREETKGVMTLDESVVHKTDVHTKQVPHELNQRKEPLTRMRREMSNSKMMISGSIGFNLESCITFGSQQPKEPMPALNQGTQECTSGSASCRGSHVHHPSIFKGLTSEDCLAWSSGVAMISNESSYPQQMSTSKKPAWIDAAVPYHNQSFGQTYDSKARETYRCAFRNSFDRISRKRCATHVWIGYLIQELKGGGENAGALKPQLHMKQEMNADPEFQVQASPSRLKSSNSNAVSVANLIEARHKPTQDDVKGSIPFLETLKKKPLQNQTPMVYKREKQALDFLSLSNGDSCVDSSSSKDGTRKGNRSGMWSCLSLGPSNNASRTYRAIPTHNDYYSPTYGSQTSAKQVGPHLPTPVGGSDLRLPEKGPRVLTKEQQMIWAAMAYPQGLHAVKFDPATRIQFSSPMVPSPLDTQFPKYTAMATQHHHQQLASLQRASPRDHCLPTGVQLYSGALPLQLL